MKSIHHQWKILNILKGIGLLLLLGGLLRAGIVSATTPYDEKILFGIMAAQPQITDARIQVLSDTYFYVSDTHLFYTNTMPESEPFVVRGQATDALTVTFSTAFGQTPPADIDLPLFTASYDVAPGAEEDGVITATAHNAAGLSARQTYRYTLDKTGPSGSVAPVGGLAATSQTTLSLALAAVDDGCGVRDMCLSDTLECSAWEPYTTTKAWHLRPVDGEHPLYVRYRDHLGNTSSLISQTVLLDRVAPQVTVFLFSSRTGGTATVLLPPVAPRTAFTVAWAGIDPEPASGVVPSYTVAYREDDGPWHRWFSGTTLRQARFVSGTMEHTYTFSATVCDKVGNCGVGTQSIRVDKVYLYLPVVIHNYIPFSNGDFEIGSLVGWRQLQGGFPGYGGSGLPQQVVSLENGKRALLGDDRAVDGAIPVGYGAISQKLTVDKPYLELQYRVLSYDIFKGPSDYLDTFEISVDDPITEVLDAHRDVVCNSENLNPTGIITATRGLVLCGGRSGTVADLGELWDSGWQTAILDLRSRQGQNVTLYFAIWSREYSAPGYNDQGWYNTWVYVDNIRLRH